MTKKDSIQVSMDIKKTTYQYLREHADSQNCSLGMVADSLTEKAQGQAVVPSEVSPMEYARYVEDNLQPCDRLMHHKNGKWYCTWRVRNVFYWKEISDLQFCEYCQAQARSENHLSNDPELERLREKERIKTDALLERERIKERCRPYRGPKISNM